MQKRIFLSIGALAFGALSNATVITQWDFNSVVPDANTSTGTTAPSTGSGTAAAIGGVTTAFVSGDASGGSTDPASGDDSAWNTTTYPAQGTGSGTAGVQFNVSTAGMQGITVTWDDRHSNTASGLTLFQYSIDGSTFIDGPTFQNTDANFLNGNTIDLTGVSGVNGDADFAFRIVTVFAPGAAAYAPTLSTSSYGTSGTIRYDMVTVAGTQSVPEPASMAVLGLGALAVARRRARR